MNELEQILKRLIEFGLLTDEEIETIRKSLLKIEMQTVPKTAYIEFMEEFNKITGKKYKPDCDSRETYYENEIFYSQSDKITALKNALTDKWIQENSHALTPKYILEAKTIAKYINYAAPKQQNKPGDGKLDISKTDYDHVTV